MLARRSAAMIEALATVAPGRPLREGIDRILQASMGALIVVGDGPDVLAICSGGFLLDAEFSPQRLSELAKMDGAIVLASDASRIARANVHLVPNPNVPTSETGTRHRTAERVARSIDVPVISVSEDMSLVGADVYASAVGGVRVVEPAADLALSLALVSAFTGVPLPDGLVACGEVGLAGEVRQAAHTSRRLAEAARLGFTRAVVSASSPPAPPGLDATRVSTLADAVHRLHLVPPQ